MDKIEAIKIATKWWAHALREPKGNKLNDPTSDLLVSWHRSMLNPPSEEKIYEFQGCLEEELSKWLNNTEWVIEDQELGSYSRQIGVDWEPDCRLKVCAQKAGIDTIFFPQKTYMRLDPDGVRIASGYGAEIEVITE